MLPVSRFVRQAVPAALLAAILGVPAHADSNLVQNPGFEITDNTLINIPDWTRSETGSAIVKRRSGAANAHSGSESALLGFFGTDNGATPGTGSLSQTIATKPGEAYNLSFYAEDLNADNPLTDPLQVTFGGTVQTVNLLNDVVIGGGSGFYTHYVLSDLTASSGAMLLQFSENFHSAGNQLTLLDDVSVTPVPESSTGVGLGLGLLGLSLAMLRARKRASPSR